LKEQDKVGMIKVELKKKDPTMGPPNQKKACKGRKN